MGREASRHRWLAAGGWGPCQPATALGCLAFAQCCSDCSAPSLPDCRTGWLHPLATLPPPSHLPPACCPQGRPSPPSLEALPEGAEEALAEVRYGCTARTLASLAVLPPRDRQLSLGWYRPACPQQQPLVSSASCCRTEPASPSPARLPHCRPPAAAVRRSKAPTHDLPASRRSAALPACRARRMPGRRGRRRRRWRLWRRRRGWIGPLSRSRQALLFRRTMPVLPGVALSARGAARCYQHLVLNGA